MLQCFAFSGKITFYADNTSLTGDVWWQLCHCSWAGNCWCWCHVYCTFCGPYWIFFFNPHSGCFHVVAQIIYLCCIIGSAAWSSAVRHPRNVFQWCQDSIRTKWMQGLFVTWTISRTCQRVVKSDYFCMKYTTLIRRQRLTLKSFPALQRCRLHCLGLGSAEWSSLFGI